MDLLISDQAKVEISNRVKDITCAYCIDNHQSEAHHQHQNKAERKIQDVKRCINHLMNKTGAPGYTWHLCLVLVIFILNHTALEVLKWKTPHQVLTGQKPDISIILRFQIWELVYYTTEDKAFPSAGTECTGQFVGFMEHVGHAMTYKVLDDTTQKILF